MSRKLKGNIILLITAFLWGSTFVAQKKAAEFIGPFTYNALRSIIASIILLGIFLVTRNKIEISEEDAEGNKVSKRKIYLFACLAGICLLVASALQQISIGGSDASIVAFLTSTYMIFVPIISFFFKKKVRRKVWLCAVFAVVGSLLLSNDGSGFSNFSFSVSSLFALGGAVFFALQIMSVDKINNHINPFLLCLIQVSVTAVGSLVIALINEDMIRENLAASTPYVLYAGVLSSCLAYSLQIIGQKYSEATIASIIMSLESVFALVSSVVMLHEVLNTYEIIGAIIIFLSVIGSQIDIDIDKIKEKRLEKKK